MQKLELRAHLIELRNRFMIVALFVVIGSVLAIIFQTEVISALLRPMDGQSLIYTSPYGGFEFIFKVILFLGLIFAIPAALYHTFQFIAPALPEKIDGLGTKIIIISSVLALTGVTFAYFIAIPASLQFLNNIGSDFLDSFISTNEYLSFFMVYLLGFAVIFQLPLVMSIIDRNHPLQPKSLIKKQKYIIAGSYVVAAILTPTPDAMNQTIMALPIVALYQIGVGVIWTQRKSSGSDNSISVAETNWYAQQPNESVAMTDDIIDLEEEKARYNATPRKRRPRVVNDMVSVKTQRATQDKPVHKPITVHASIEKTIHPKTNYVNSAPEHKLATKLPLSYSQHNHVANKPRNLTSTTPSVARHARGPTMQTTKTPVNKKKQPVAKLDTIQRLRQEDRQRASYVNTMIKSRPEPLMQG